MKPKQRLKSRILDGKFIASLQVIVGVFTTSIRKIRIYLLVFIEEKIEVRFTPQKFTEKVG